jgi:lipopolysaccharide export system protein LptA
VEYREFGGSPAVQRLVRSRNLDAALKNGFAEISDARFTGSVQFNDGPTRAAAATVRYQTASGSVDLAGNIGNAPPHVVNDQVDVSAGHIEMTLDGPKMTATEGPVKTVLKPSKPAPDKEATKMPGLMDQDKPVSGSSDKLVYDGSNGSRAEFTGAARLFQGDTLVQGAKITVDGHTGNLQAEGGVKSTLIVNDTDPETKKPVASRAAGSGTTMQYEDADRRVTYTTSAHVTGPQGDIVASTIALTLAKESQDVEHMTADGSVTLRENGRVTTGDKLVYVAKDETYTMSGKVAKMIEANCRQNTGTILRFEKSTDNLYIDGADESRMQTTKAAPGCIPRPD